MKYYYEVQFNNDYDSNIYYSELNLQKKDVVVVPVSDDEFEIATILKKVSTTRGLKQEVDYGEVLPIIERIDVSEYIRSRRAKAKKAQVLAVLNAKMADIKAMETLEKFAGKDTSFASLLSEFKSLANGQIPLGIDEEDE